MLFVVRHIMRVLILMIILISVLPDFTLGQSPRVKEIFQKNCEIDNRSWDSISVDNQVLKYFFVEKKYDFTDQQGKFHFSGEVLLDVDKKAFDSITLNKIFHQISIKIQLNKFIVLRNCQAYRIFTSTLAEKSEFDIKYLIDNFVGKYNKSIK